MARSSAREMVLYYVRQQVLAIMRYDPLVRRDEPDAVHQMRVATRRARSALQASASKSSREPTRPLCEELSGWRPNSGRPCDGEVLLARLTAELTAISARPGQQGWSRLALPGTSPPNSDRRPRPPCTPSTGSATSICSMTWTRSSPIRR